MTRRIAIRGVIVSSEGKIFAVKHQSYRDDKPVDYWCTPGGGIDEGESLLPALEREMIEETAVKPIIGNLLYIQQFANGEEEQLEFFFQIKNADDYQNIDLSATTHGETEIAEFGFVDPKSVTLLPKFLVETDVLADIEFSKTQIFNYL